MTFEAYSVSVRLRLMDLVTPGVALIGRSIRGLNSEVGAAEASLKRLGIAGAALAAGGAFGLSLFKVPLEEAKKFQTEVARFTSLGFGDKVNADAVKFATGMKTFGTSARDNMTLVSDAMAVFKNLNHAEMAAPLLAKMKFANQAVFGASGSANESKFMDMMKVVEFRGGLSSDAEFHTQANFVQKVISGSRNRVDASALLLALKTGGAALSRRDNDAFYLGSEPLIQEFGGSRYGTAAMSIYQNLVQSRGSITAQQELFRLGLLDKDKVLFNNQGRLKKALPGAFLGGDILTKQGELSLLEKVLMPAFAAKGITTDEGIINELSMILGNRTGSSLMSRIYLQRAILKLQTNANRSAQGIDELDATGRQTLAGQEIELEAKWRDVLKELGTTVLPIAIQGVQGLTSFLKSAIGFAREFPMLTSAITLSSAAIFALAGAGGSLMLLRAGLGGLGLILGAGATGAEVGLLGAVAGLLGPIGLAIAGITALAVVMNLIKPDTKDDGKDHTGQHWERNASGRGGSWMPNVRTVGAHRGYPGTIESWVPNSDGTGSYLNLGSGTNGVASPASREVVHVTELHMDGRQVAQVVTKHQAREASRPQSGGAGFDNSMMLTPSGG